MSLEETRLSLRGLFAEIEQKNLELSQINQNLEGIVEERTRTIKVILDNVNSGFFLVDRGLLIQEGFTKSCVKLFGQDQLTGKHLAQMLARDKRALEHFETCFEQVLEDFLPEEVSLDQMPQRFRLPGKTISLTGRTVRDSKNQITHVLFTAVDITALEVAESENKQNRAIIRILQNLSSFQDFVQESRSRIGSIKEAFTKVMRRSFAVSFTLSKATLPLMGSMMWLISFIRLKMSSNLLPNILKISKAAWLDFSIRTTNY